MADANVVPMKRERTTKRWFVDKAGEKSGRAHTEAVGFGIEYVGTGKTIEATLSDYSPGVVNAAALFGLVTSITNAAGGADKSDEDRLNASQDRHEALLEGEWSAEREVGMRTTDVVEAAWRIQKAKGIDLDRDSYKAKILSGAVDPSALLQNAKFAATFAAIQAEKKQARAQAMAAKVSDEDNEALDDLLGA